MVVTRIIGGATYYPEHAVDQHGDSISWSSAN